jgi:lipopolysaccharide exporter
MKQPGNQQVSNREALVKGAAWTIASRWTSRLLGFANTVILARLLTPADYGLVLMASLFMGLLQVVNDQGPVLYLMRNRNPSQSDLHATWTARIFCGFGTGAFLAASGPLFAWYYGQPELVLICLALAFCQVAQGFNNVGLFLSQLQFDFSLEFRVNVISKVIGSAAAILTAVLFRSYWALVIGSVASHVAACLLGYLFHPYRPRFSTQGLAAIWTFTRWTILAGAGTYMVRKADDFLAAKFGGSKAYGSYAVGAELGAMPLTELGPTMLKALLPVLARIQHSKDEMKALTFKCMCIVNAVAFPIGAGMAAVAGPATLVVLGDKWQAATPFVAVFALVSLVNVISNPLNTLLIAQGAVKAGSKVMAIEVVGFAASAAYLYPTFGLAGLAYARFLASVCGLITLVEMAKLMCALPRRDLLRSAWRPALGSVAMCFCVLQAMTLVSGSVFQLIVGISSGALVYAVWCILSWLASGRPEGLESTALEVVRARLMRRPN